jgi:hypothetical protein
MPTYGLLLFHLENYAEAAECLSGAVSRLKSTFKRGQYVSHVFVYHLVISTSVDRRASLATDHAGKSLCRTFSTTCFILCLRPCICTFSAITSEGRTKSLVPRATMTRSFSFDTQSLKIPLTSMPFAHSSTSWSRCVWSESSRLVSCRESGSSNPDIDKQTSSAGRVCSPGIVLVTDQRLRWHHDGSRDSVLSRCGCKAVAGGIG